MEFHERQQKKDKTKTAKGSEAIGRKTSRDFINFLYLSSASDLSSLRSQAIAIVAAVNMKEIELNYLSNCSD